MKGFYIEQEISDFDLIRSADLSEALIQGFRRTKPLYQYISSLTPEEDLIEPTKNGRTSDAE